MHQITLRQSIQKVQEVALAHGFTIVIVGGALVRLIGQKTKIKKIDEKKKIILLEQAENPGIARGEDKKTNVDIDGIAFSHDKDAFAPDVRHAYKGLQKSLKNLQKNTLGFPAISIEPVLYHPIFPKPRTLFQFVSSIETYHQNHFLFRLGSITQEVQTASLDFWTYTFSETNEQVTSLSPLAIQERYAIRGFSVKPKDRAKMWGEASSFAKFVKEFNAKTHARYVKDYTEWHIFEKNIQDAPQPSMKVKKALWNTYWQTIGTYFAHGTGLIGKLLLPLGNTFFAGK